MTFLGDDPLPIRQLDGGHDPGPFQRIRGQHKDLHGVVVGGADGEGWEGAAGIFQW